MQRSPKSTLVAQIQAHLEVELAALVKAAETARDAATSEESRPENKYDTRGLEASYLAGAQQERATVVRNDLQRLRDTIFRDFNADDAVTATALVELDLAGTRLQYFVLAIGAGYPLLLDGRTVVAITPASPLGRALLGKKKGEVATVHTGQGDKDYEILSVS